MDANLDAALISLLAVSGRRIAVIAESQSAANMLGDEVSVAGQANIRRWVKASGQEEIQFKSGGFVFLMSRRGPNRVRGRRFDLIVIDDHRYLQDEEFMMGIVPCFSDASGGRPRIGVLVI